MKKKLCHLLFIMGILMILIITPAWADDADVVDSGTCGDDLTWVLTEDGTLTISGTGEMESYSSGYPLEIEKAPWYSYRDEITSVIIEDGVTSVGSFAFYDCTNITNISLPDSLTSIQSHAFYYCSSLTSISLPDNVASIGEAAFSDCSNLTCISLPDSINYIADLAFARCESMISISLPDNITSIEYATFYKCSSLTSISIPKNVTFIGGLAFAYCESLTSIFIPDSVTSINTQAFFHCYSLTDVYYSGSEEDWADIAITNTASDHYGNSCLTSATIHYNSTDKTSSDTEITQITWSFNSNTGMLTISGEGDMDDWDVFSLEDVPWYDYLDQITSINVKDGVTNIGQSAFYGCENLEFVMLPDTLESISAYAFYDCLSLTDVYYAGSEADWLFVDYYTSEYGNEKLLNATIHYDCIGRFSVTADVWDFAHSAVAYTVDDNVYYFLTSADFIRLYDSVSSLSNTDVTAVFLEQVQGDGLLAGIIYDQGLSTNYTQQYVIDGMTIFDEDEYDILTWTGSCFGMAAWIVLNGNGTLAASDLDNDANWLADIEIDDTVRSAINFYQAQQNLTVSNQLTNEFMELTQTEQLELLADLAEEAQNGGDPVLIRIQYYKKYNGENCDTSSSSGHTLVALGVEDGDYTDQVYAEWQGKDGALDGEEFTHCVIIYDINYRNAETSNLYYSDNGVWCIPAYGLVSTESDSRDTIYNNAQFVLITADSEAINLVDYNTGELSSIASGSVDSVSYITSLIDSNYSVSWDGYSADISGFSVFNNTSDKTINVVVNANATADGDSTSTSSTAFLPNSDEYTVTSDEEELFFYLNTGNYLTMAATTSSGSITFQDDGGATVSTEEEAAAYISITANDGYTDLDWYRFEVVAEETTDLSAELTDDGILITGEVLSDVIINGISDDEDECITAEFSTEEDSALVTTDEEDELLVLIDDDGDGTCETPIEYEWYEEDDTDPFEGVRKLSDGNWYYVENDDEVIDYTGLVKNDGTYGTAGWYYVENGKVTFSYSGLVKYDGTTGGKAGWYYVKNGHVDFSITDIVYNNDTYGKAGWYYVKNAYVDFSYSGLVKHSASNGGTAGWYYVKNAYVDFSYSGLVYNPGTYGVEGWWYVKNACVKFSYTGICANSSGTWYVKNGRVDFSYSGRFIIFTIKNGKVVA